MSEIKEKIIIENRTSRTTAEIMPFVSHVLQAGKISDNGKQYCYITTWPGTQVFVAKNKSSFRFVVTED